MNIKLLLSSLIALGLLNCPRQKDDYDVETILWSADYSPDGKEIAVGGNHQKLFILDAQNLEVKKEIATPNTITCLDWHPDGKRIAVAVQIAESGPFLYNTQTTEHIFLDSISVVGARATAWSPDGNTLAVGDNEGFLLLYQKDGSLIQKMKVEKIITGLSWHPTQNLIATSGSQISLVNLDTEEIESFPLREEEVLYLCVDWHWSGLFFAAGDYGDFEKDYPPMLHFIHPFDGPKMKSEIGSKLEYRSIQWEEGQANIATASDGLRIWEFRNPWAKVLKHKKSSPPLWGLDWNRDGTQLVTTSGGGEVILWDQQFKEVKRVVLK
ncbi:MAG: WD40 repeat domain-containing protein [Bacteroidetes bacterium]|nr:WD40 repeat domain-containing protein [Bacteroidota bacterium]